MPNHPFLVHVPLALALVLPWLALGVLLAIGKGALPGRTWSIVFVLQLVLTGSGFVAMESGEEEEERVEELVPHDPMEHHEENGERFAKWNVPVLLFTLLPLVVFRQRHGPRLALMAISLAGMALAAFFGVQTGQSGGALVYEHQAARAYQTTPNMPAPTGIPAHTTHEDE